MLTVVTCSSTWSALSLTSMEGNFSTVRSLCRKSMKFKKPVQIILMEDHRVLPAESQRKSLSPVYSRCRALGRTGSDLTWRQRSPSCARPGERGPARSCNSPLCSGPGRSPAQLVGQITTNIAFLAEICGDILPSGPSKFFPTRFGDVKASTGNGSHKALIWSDLSSHLLSHL